jgi:UDP-glucose 4-epimerase
MAANSDIQSGAKYLDVDMEKTFLTTFNVLNMMKRHSVKQLVFASTSAVYGESSDLLHEDFGPLFPISFYGAAKLASEAYITHGAMFDFMNRLTECPGELTILGDGEQTKPYLYVEDLVDGMLFAWVHASEALNYFNVGVDSATRVTDIAKIVVEEMGLANVNFHYTGGDRGWVGDVPTFWYDVSKIRKLGWQAPRTSNEAMRAAVQAELQSRSKI